MTFKITGTPGNKIQLAFQDYPYTKTLKTMYFNMPTSSGVFYYKYKFPAGSGYYRAYVFQYHPCTDNDEAFFGFN
ncbi:MAG: hypothetical protein ACQEUT_12380 [Bacillota bacterium]